MSETSQALRSSASKITHALWCHLCEIFIAWALKIAPDDYTPSCVQALVNVMDKQR